MRSLPAVTDTLVIHIDGSGNRRRQGQAALAKVEVNGDAYVYGRLEIIVDSDPQPGALPPPATPLRCAFVLYTRPYDSCCESLCVAS